MPLTHIPTDISLHIIACLPLGSIGRVKQVQKSWKKVVDTNENGVYRNAALLHRFVLSVGTSLLDAISALDFDTSPFSIGGWREFCILRLGIEKNWTGSGPSELTIRSQLRHLHRKAIPNSECTISTSGLGRIAVWKGNELIWALPADYDNLQMPPYFVYDEGYLAFVGREPNTIEVWHEATLLVPSFSPSPAQRIAAESSATVYGHAGPGHFLPCYVIPLPEDAPIKSGGLQLMYPTLLLTTAGNIHVWNLSTGTYLRTIPMHMPCGFEGVEISRDHILVFDAAQIRLFSRYDGNLLFDIFRTDSFIPMAPVAIQLSPPRSIPTAFDGAVLERQVLFPKRKKWVYLRGEFRQVAISPCGTTLVAASSNNRLLIIYDLHQLITGALPAQQTAVEIQIGAEYRNSGVANLAVTQNRIAVATGIGILVITLDRSGSASIGSMQLPIPSGLSPRVRLSASFLRLRSIVRLANLRLVSNTKLTFDGEPTVRANKMLLRSRKETVNPSRPVPRAGESAINENDKDSPDCEEEDDADSIPDLLSSSEGEDNDEESEVPSDEEGGAQGGPSEASDEPVLGVEDSDWSTDSDDDNGPEQDPIHAAQGIPPGLLPSDFGNMRARNIITEAAFVINTAPRF